MDSIKPGCLVVLTHHDPSPLHIYTDSGRFYQIGEHQYPGVGNILSATESPEQQDFWQQYRANPENVVYSDRAKSRGKLFHAAVEHHFRSDAADDDAIAQVSSYWHSAYNVLQRITNPLLVESAVWHPIGCYAGTVDMVCSFDGVPVILDWKTATKPKQVEWLNRYPLQLAAYCGAVNRMYGTSITQGVVVVALPEQEAQVFQFSLGDYWRLWLNRLVGYWSQQSTPLAAQALSRIRSEYGQRLAATA